MDSKKLVSEAIEAMKKSYSPYSNFKVGATLLSSDGEIYTGCNIENASYTPTVCAERVAFFKALSEGKKQFAAIAVVGGVDGKLSSFTYPCGVCRQVMREFCSDDFRIILYNGESVRETTLGEILPCSFGPDNLV